MTVGKPAFDAQGRRTEIVSTYRPTIEELRLLRHVALRKDHEAVYGYTTDPEVAAQLGDCVYYQRAPGVTEYEFVFGHWAVETAKELIEERAQNPS